MSGTNCWAGGGAGQPAAQADRPGHQVREFVSFDQDHSQLQNFEALGSFSVGPYFTL